MRAGRPGKPQFRELGETRQGGRLSGGLRTDPVRIHGQRSRGQRTPKDPRCSSDRERAA